MKWTAVTVLVMLAVVLSLGAACFTADKDPEDDDDPAPSDDDAADDDAGDDDAADDDAVDDDADDDADDDDDFGDDDTQITVDCSGMMEFVYETCGDTFENESTQERLDQGEAELFCDEGGAIWKCVQECLDDVLEQPDGHCSGLVECVDTRCTGAIVLVDLP
ncbi:MAG: hypothetical protein M5R36_11765 [Deltaproteobacteria bacterium]|nr:hypothetical protein [Deltaproteobacteria bacterium]